MRVGVTREYVTASARPGTRQGLAGKPDQRASRVRCTPDTLRPARKPAYQHFLLYGVT